MKPSHYLKIWPLPEKPGFSLLYSTRNSSVALLPDEASNVLLQNIVPAEIGAQLHELGMAVSDLAAERNEVYSILSDVNRMTPVVRVAVILGLECNFSCKYCYEGTLKAKVGMTDRTADLLIELLKKRFKTGKKKMVLDLYGGEPLLFKNRIKYLASPLQPYVEERGGVFELNLVTNGSLLTKKTAEEFKPYGLKSAKVTLDGPPGNHNNYRPLKNGGGCFDLIVKNLKECCDLLEVNLSGNYTKDNYKEFPALLDLLPEKGLGPEKLSHVVFHPVIRTTDAFSPPEFSGGCVSINEPWLFEASVFLRGEIIRRGFKTHEIQPEICAVVIDDAFTVNHDGSIYKCAPLVGNEQYIIGDVEKGIEDFSTVYYIDRWQKEEICRECEYLPLCFGGCRYMSFQRDGDMAKVDCQKPFLDATLETFVKQGIGSSSND